MTRRRTVIDLLGHASKSDGTGLRLLDRNENPSWYTWAELHSRASRVAGGMREVGIERGDRVALVYATSVAFFDAFFGTLLAGAVPVPLYPPVRFGRLDEYADRTASMLQAVDAGMVLASSGVRRLLDNALSGPEREQR